MRRLLLSLLGLSWLALAGCEHYCVHGECDCWLFDHCCTRAPWVYQRPPATLGTPVGASVLPAIATPGAPSAPTAPVETVPPPSPMPQAKELPKGE